MTEITKSGEPLWFSELIDASIVAMVQLAKRRSLYSGAFFLFVDLLCCIRLVASVPDRALDSSKDRTDTLSILRRKDDVFGLLEMRG